MDKDKDKVKDKDENLKMVLLKEALRTRKRIDITGLVTNQG